MVVGSQLARAALGLACTLALWAVPAYGRVVPGDAFLCGEARAPKAARGAPVSPAFHPRVAVPVVDRFARPLANGRYTLDLRKPEAFCRPVRLDDDDLIDPLHGLELYESRRTRRKPPLPPLPATTEAVDTALGTLRLRVGNVETLAVPTMATGSVGGTGVERDHFVCYAVRPERDGGARPGGVRVPVRTVDGPRMLELKKAVALCVPASVRGEDPGAPKHPIDLVCWDARLADKASAAGASEVVATRNGFGHELLKVAAPRRLCVPAARTDVAIPTPTPFPTFTPPPTPAPTATPVVTPLPPSMRIEPAGTDGLLRDKQCLSAIFVQPDGGTVDLTATALWNVVDGTIAVSAGFLDGKKCFLGVGIGTTAITARDAGTGVTSPPATLQATWPIFKLTATPKYVGMRTGTSDTLTVIAELTGGRTRNVTQHVSYASSDGAVAAVPNAAGNRSRIDAEGRGRAIITVTDPFSSLTDTANVAVGDLESVVVERERLLFPGETAAMKAVGSFDGFVGNVTELAAWISSDPSVAIVSNAAGERGRVAALTPGTALITATDLESGITSTCCGTVSVLGDALDLLLTPTLVERRLGVDTTPVRISARGSYTLPPAGSGSRTVDARVAWSSSDESVVAIGDVDEDHGREILLVGGGQASVVATDPSNGLASAPATVTVYEDLERVEVGTSPTDPTKNDERTILVGQAVSYTVRGYFDGGHPRVLREASLEVGDPRVAEVDRHAVYGLAPGTVTISGIDGPTGLSSRDGGRDAVLHVIGGIVRVALSPSVLTLEPGQAGTLTALGYDTFGGTQNLTQRVTYTSSDPAVVVASNEVGNRSRIVAVGAGTATISGIDFVTGIGSTTTGDDVVVTVLDDPLDRIEVSPAARHVAAGATSRFSAIAYYASGLARNFTQRVEWISSDPAVALAPNASGDRSRIETVGPGTAVISARDPQTGVSSSDAGRDATLTVGALTAIVISPAATTIPVGGAFSFTTQGATADGATVNLTQDVVYASSDPTVAIATNAVGNRSQVWALAPGVTTITAFRASAYPQVTESEPATLTVVPAP